MPRRHFKYNILRWQPGTDSIELVATAADHAPSRNGRSGFHPFAERDAWTAGADGRVAVVCAEDYRLRWIESNREVDAGPEISFNPIPVTAAERDGFRLERAQQPAPCVRFGATTGSCMQSRIGLEQVRRDFPDEHFPPFLPPFGEKAVVRSPNGDLWVTRSASSGTLAFSIDILGSSGRVLRTVMLPPARRVVALDRRGVYLSHVADDGTELLERYPWPSELR
jgi:hypothetical protein